MIVVKVRSWRARLHQSKRVSGLARSRRWRWVRCVASMLRGAAAHGEQADDFGLATAHERGVNEARLDRRWAEIDELAARGVGEEQVVEQLRFVRRSEGLLSLQLVEATARDDEISEVGVNETTKRSGEGKLALHRAKAGGGETLGKVGLIDGFIAKPAEVAVGGENVRHHLMIERLELIGGKPGQREWQLNRQGAGSWARWIDDWDNFPTNRIFLPQRFGILGRKILLVRKFSGHGSG